jgi:outer membrane lipopolysaccharide assembly protein LptE/RlpB
MFLDRKIIRTFLTVSCCLVFLAACGYKFAGGGGLPSGIQSVFITMLANQTSETGVENIFTNDLIYEFTRRDKLEARSKADAVLSGTVKSMSVHTISHIGTSTSLERRVTITLDLKLTDSEGRTIWSKKGISDNEAYSVSSDKLATEKNRRDAIAVLSKRLAEKIYNSMTEDF